jgi:hypothetical protein
MEPAQERTTEAQVPENTPNTAIPPLLGGASQVNERLNNLLPSAHRSAELNLPKQE